MFNKQEEIGLIYSGNMKKTSITTYLFQFLIFSIMSVLVIGVILVSLGCIFLFAGFDVLFKSNISCGKNCQFSLVESIPDQINLQRPNGVLKSHEVFKKIILSAKTSLKIGSFYWTLNNTRLDAGGNFGNEVLQSIYEAKRINPSLNIEIIQQKPDELYPSLDTQELLRNGIISKLVNIDLKKSVGGVQHSKFLIADEKEFYVGSCNFDWRSFAQVKELGVYVESCPCLGQDFTKIFNFWSYFGDDLQNVPSSNYPSKYSTDFTDEDPFQIEGKNETFSAFLAQSPPLIMNTLRSTELNSLLHTIHEASTHVNISVMDFYPFELYGEKKVYWDEINKEIKEAMLRGVEVNLLISKWNNTHVEMLYALQSLQDFSKICEKGDWCSGSIHVKLMVFPGTFFISNGLDVVGYPSTPFTRVNHAKYLISDKRLFISTSNWSADYFYKTFGVGFLAESRILMDSLQSIFVRDWNSIYAKPLNDFIKQLEK
jgi:phospholipase D3/4